MINFNKARKYCCEDISLIENYEHAKNDLIQTWHIHHRKEEEGYSRQDLNDKGLYYKRPASELVFLTKSQHQSLHMKGVPKSEEHRKKISEAQIGKYISEKTRKKISEAHKGEKSYWYGKKHTEETKKKISESHKGEKCYLYGKTGEKHNCSKPVMQIDKNTGQIIKTWPCTYEVERVLRINNSGISMCCSGKRKSAGGYVWKYADI